MDCYERMNSFADVYLFNTVRRFEYEALTETYRSFWHRAAKAVIFNQLNQSAGVLWMFELFSFSN